VSLKVRVFYQNLQQYMGNQASVEVSGRTVGECLEDLIRQFPGAGKLIFNEHGQLLKHVFVYVNAESARKAELKAKVRENDELIIAVLLSGG
jgi:molybdopterin converting factor small subunit